MTLQSLPPLVADLLAGGRELRPAQVELATLVKQAIDTEMPLVAEAGTGTGKTMSYVIPLVRSGKTGLISTSNKALQSQILYKDVPFVQEHIQDFPVALIKGVGNYLCKERFINLTHDTRNENLSPQVGQLHDSMEDGWNGDFELLQIALPPELRSQINGNSDLCTWNLCEFFASCYIRQMRDAAKLAQVVIVNHALLLLDAALGGLLLPEREVIVIDEAHHLAEEATNAFTASVRPNRVLSLLKQKRLQVYAPPKLLIEIGGLSDDLWSQIERTSFGKGSRLAFQKPNPVAMTLVNRLRELIAELRLARPEDMETKEAALYDKLLTRTQNLAKDLHLIFAVEHPEQYVHYLERIQTPRESSFQANAAPLSVAQFLQEHLFEKTPTVIMTSATLATGSQFTFFRRTVGLSSDQEVIERVLPLVFDYKANSLLYVPRHLPEPAYGEGAQVERYIQAIATEMQQLVLASRGRAFLLFSSRKMLDEVYARIGNLLPFPVLRQGDLSTNELTRRFRAEAGSVLFGLKSFWEGVDIAGDALSLVVIDRLPFSVPDDPIHEARVNQMKARGENWFVDYVLPQVILQLKQGVGRLIRTPDDRGVMAILDTRLHTKGYGRTVIQALPQSRRSAALKDVQLFFDNH